MSVKRYDMKEVFKGRMAVVETSAGAFVTHGDYSVIEQKLTDMSVQLANAESKCRELAAENAGLKADHVRIFNSGYQRGHEATVEGYYLDIHQNDITTYHEDVVAEIEEEETPATDAFLSEVRASAVDDVFLKISNAIVNCYQDEQIGLDAAATICGDFASQLRQEAAQ